MGEERVCIGSWWGNRKEGDCGGDLGVDGWIIWRRLHNEELNDLYSSPNIVRVIKSRRMRWAGHVARMGEERGCIASWWGNRREGDCGGDLGVDGWIILEWISRRWDVGIWTGLG